jgi:hypothetical protein
VRPLGKFRSLRGKVKLLELSHVQTNVFGYYTFIPKAGFLSQLFLVVSPKQRDSVEDDTPHLYRSHCQCQSLIQNAPKHHTNASHFNVRTPMKYKHLFTKSVFTSQPPKQENHSQRSLQLRSPQSLRLSYSLSSRLNYDLDS